MKKEVKKVTKDDIIAKYKTEVLRLRADRDRYINLVVDLRGALSRITKIATDMRYWKDF